MPRDPVSFVVEGSQPGARLDLFLAARLDDVSRGAVQRLIESGCVRVNGRHAKPTQTPRAGDRIDIRWPSPALPHAQPQDIPLAVLFEDDDLLVINKPAGLVVHPAAGHAEGTLVNAVLHHCAGRLSGIGGVARPGIVHRLDKDTSGCLIVAKHDAAHLALAAQFANRDVLKIYQTIVCGQIEEHAGEIHAAIARHPNHRKRMAVTSGGREAWTSYTVRDRLESATWVEAVLHTGRTHQIRVHFHHLGHPVVGDPTYGKRANTELARATAYRAPRQLLHAWRLQLKHPIRGIALMFTAPVPDDFALAWEAFRVSTSALSASPAPVQSREKPLPGNIRQARST